MRASFLINAHQREHFSLVAHCEANMPPKSRRKRQPENARAAKRMKVDGGEGIETSRTESEALLGEPSLARPIGVYI